MTDAEMFDTKLWRKRMLTIIFWTSIISSGASFLGAQMLSPGRRLTAQTARIDTLQTVTEKHTAQLDSLGRQSKTNIYLTCEVLRRVNPQGAVQPEGCR